jgi:hypothetical protein
VKHGTGGPADGARGGMYRPNGTYNGSKDPSTARTANPITIPARSEPPVQKPMQEAAVTTPAVEKAKGVDVPSTPTPAPAFAAPAPIEKPAEARKSSRSIAEGLRVLFDQHRGLPEQAAVLGNSEDNLPVLLDLNDPASGAVVVIGDEREQQIDLLRTAVTSIAMRATPRSAQILIISRDPQSWREWITAQGYQRFSIGIEGVEDMDVLSEWILRLGDWTEQRRTGERSGPPILLVLDTLSFMTRLPYDIRLNFEWMVKEGPAARIWPLAAISTELAGVLNGRRLLRSFPTRVLGFTEQSAFYTEFGSMSAAEAEQFGEPGIFAVNPGECWLRFRPVTEKQR